ncbi:acyltransferase [Aureimonas flava]|uniref:Acyltransferase n=1 Tax=Aureimonas flava TaxID=2320271 RepID=A0A3A1WV41_9HYPH|nr:acyltransferase family protein [Aureimonas flava]RIY02541.1 acyltransferase [Aureimonas flava]
MHYRIFDCWRFCAAILVMTYHFLFFAPGADARSGTDLLHHLSPLLDTFFMISGFVIAARYAARMNTMGDYRRFLRRRVARLYPLHLLTLLFFGSVGAAGALGLVTLHDLPRWNMADLPFHVLALHAWGTTARLAFDYPNWSVSAEFFCYLLFPAVVLVLRRAGVSGLCFLLFGWIAVLEVWSRGGVFPGAHWTGADTFGAYRAFADFTAGALAAALVERRVLPVVSHGPGFLALAAALATMVATPLVHLTLALLFLSILLIGLSESARPRSTERLEPWMALMRLSFGIYILHAACEIVFLSFLWKRVLEPMHLVGFYAYLAVPMLATITLAWVCARFVEAPIGRRLAGVPPRPAVLAGA